MSKAPVAKKQLLHLVLGGELEDLKEITFKDLSKVDIVGVYPDYASAYAVWKGKAQQTQAQLLKAQADWSSRFPARLRNARMHRSVS